MPTRPRDTWSCTFWKTPSSYLSALSCRSGRVVAGGEELYLLRPGEQRLLVRPPGRDMGEIYAVAVERRAPWRIAIAHELGGVRVIHGDASADVRRSAPDQEMVATHVAWGANPDALWVRWDDGELARFSGEGLQDVASFDQLGPIDALAADDRGVVGLVGGLDTLEPFAGTLRDGETFGYRVLRMDESLSPWEVHVAVAGEAIAVALDDFGAYLSRSLGEPLALCPSLENACAVAFEGASTDAALFGAVSFSSTRSFVRVDGAGTAVRVVDLEAEGSKEPANVSALAWDASRGTLWAASKSVGLMACTAPGAKGRSVVS